MSVRSKMLIAILLVFTAIIGLAFGIGSYLSRQSFGDDELTEEEMADLVEAIETFEEKDFPATPFELNIENLTFDLPENWELVGHAPNRNVDRYRFEDKKEEGRLTFSFYPNGAKDSFEAVITTRYGAGYIKKTEDITINGFKAKRLYSAFLDVGNTTDVIYQIDEKTYVSVYGILGEDAQNRTEILQQIDFAQRSLRKKS